MFDKIEHLGIAVKDAQKSKELFSALFNTPPYKEEEVISFAEEQANKIIEKLRLDRKEQPKKSFFKK